MGQARYEDAVARGIEYIHAGDVYQVNLAHRLAGLFSGSAREAFAALVESARPWHGAYMESAEDRVLSAESGKWAIMAASPELFLKVEGRRVVTRPMKGTWPGSRDPAELRESGKDRAELNMIIDLMRNDLGRVCRFGTVKVEEARAIERHGDSKAQRERAQNASPEGNRGVWQGVGTVVGELREGVDLVDLLAAAFPAGSVTGAPKIRAMQIIDELEVSERGPYCGSIGWIGDDGRVCLNVAIRTALVREPVWKGEPDRIEDGEISYSVGAGIVAESVPRREWEETMQKAGVMRGLGASM
jgi:para-aminobenzoate synthetase component 1